MFCGGEFQTSTKGVSYYINYNTFDDVGGGNLSGPNYSIMQSYLKTGGVDNANGYKWIVFKAGGPTEDDAKALYDSIGINSSETEMRSRDDVEVYIYKDDKWGNLTKGVDFDGTAVWWDISPTNLSDTRGAWDNNYVVGNVDKKIRLANNAGGDVYFLIGLKNSVSLSLIKT